MRHTFTVVTRTLDEEIERDLVLARILHTLFTADKRTPCWWTDKRHWKLMFLVDRSSTRNTSFHISLRHTAPGTADDTKQEGWAEELLLHLTGIEKWMDAKQIYKVPDDMGAANAVTWFAIQLQLALTTTRRLSRSVAMYREDNGGFSIHFESGDVD